MYPRRPQQRLTGSERKRKCAKEILDMDLGVIRDLLGCSAKDECRIRREARNTINTLDNDRARTRLYRQMLYAGIKPPRRYQIGCGRAFCRDYNCGDKGWEAPFATQFCPECKGGEWGEIS